MVQGLDKLTRKLTVTIPQRVQEATRKAMEKGAEETVQMMKRLVPVESGALRDSIGWTWGDAPAGSFSIGTVGGREYGTLRITIFAGNEQTKVGNRKQFQLARLQEFGTQATAANPYFYPSWRTMRKRVKSRITREMRKAIKSEQT